MNQLQAAKGDGGDSEFHFQAGVPAKPMKKRFPDHIIEALLEIKWWDWPVDVIKANIDLIYNTKVDEDVIEKMQNIKVSITNAD